MVVRRAARRPAVRRLKEGLREWKLRAVPLYPSPSLLDVRRLWGEPDAQAWERAHEWYLSRFDHFSDIQDQRPAALSELEAGCWHG